MITDPAETRRDALVPPLRRDAVKPGGDALGERSRLSGSRAIGHGKRRGLDGETARLFREVGVDGRVQAQQRLVRAPRGPRHIVEHEASLEGLHERGRGVGRDLSGEAHAEAHEQDGKVPDGLGEACACRPLCLLPGCVVPRSPVGDRPRRMRSRSGRGDEREGMEGARREHEG